MITQAEIANALLETLPQYVIDGTVVSSQAVTRVDDAGNAQIQLLTGEQITPVVAVFDGLVSRERLTRSGFTSRFQFDLLLYLVNVPEEAGLSEDDVRVLMATLESQVAEFVNAEGGNRALWNAVDYAGGAPSDLVATLAQSLFAARIIPIQVVSFN